MHIPIISTVSPLEQNCANRIRARWNGCFVSGWQWVVKRCKRERWGMCAIHWSKHGCCSCVSKGRSLEKSISVNWSVRKRVRKKSPSKSWFISKIVLFSVSTEKFWSTNRSYIYTYGVPLSRLFFQQFVFIAFYAWKVSSLFIAFIFILKRRWKGLIGTSVIGQISFFP